jgi:hypothetical protein
MAVYVVACELNDVDQTYENFRSAIEGYDGQQLLGGVYLVDSPADAETVRHHLAALAGPNDRIWVSRLTDDHSGYVMAPAASWLDERKPL